ncbi:unnamed protein product [Heligmosomoides polygyrus]|uniref:Uncharacterized protein n=1 Tax=Heligmosomoides polygyrus TaxID=6339 RepID=A0A183G2Q0_HELPZ|nr:unnamed protein product [Heligmosomoides polygyrus]
MSTSRPAMDVVSSPESAIPAAQVATTSTSSSTTVAVAVSEEQQPRVEVSIVGSPELVKDALQLEFGQFFLAAVVEQRLEGNDA